MGIWILLTLASAVALYLAISLNKGLLMAATGVAMGLGILMMVLRVLLQKQVRRELGRR
jgi:Flp pilus assembly protein TadB